VVFLAGKSLYIWHAIPNIARGDAMGKNEIIKKYNRLLDNGDLIIAEVIRVGDMKYKDGIMYTFRCIDSDGNTRFAIENGHERPHIHIGEKKETVDYDWKAAWAKFKRLQSEHEQKMANGD